jgi:two-component system, OmpR family, response regulator QseB
MPRTPSVIGQPLGSIEMRILVLEDDLQLGRALQTILAQNHWKSVWVRHVADAKRLIESDAFSIVLMDISLPDGSGLDALQYMRESGNRTPVIMLTARDTVDDRVRGLDAGADDYLPKPFALEELKSRIRALARRSSGFASKIWSLGRLTIDTSRQQALLDEERLDLSPREFQLLIKLASRAGHYITRAQLEAALFNLGSAIDSNALEVHIHNLRRKVGQQSIKTIRGVGYLLEERI